MDENTFHAVQRTGHIAVVHDGCIFLWGGYKECENESNQRYLPGTDVWEYDPLFEQWFYHKCSGNAPPGTSGAAAVIVGYNLYCFGGYTKDGNTSDLFCLNLKSFIWNLVTVEGPKPIPCDKMVGWAHNDSLFFFGGFGLEPTTDIKRSKDFEYVVDNHTPIQFRRGWNNQLVSFKIGSKNWNIPQYKGCAPVARAAHACAKVYNKVYIMGGRHLESRMNDLHCFNMETLEWSGRLNTPGENPEDRSWHSLTNLNDEFLLLYGGFSQETLPLSDSWLLHISSLTWHRLDFSPNKPRLWHTASLILPGEIIICGGCSGNILNHVPAHDHTLDVIVLQFTPKSLLRLCLDKIIECQSLLRSDWGTLPCNIQNVLIVRSGCSSAQARSLGGS